MSSTNESINTAIRKSPGSTSTTHPLLPGTVLGGQTPQNLYPLPELETPSSTKTKLSKTPVKMGKKSGEGEGGAMHSVASAASDNDNDSNGDSGSLPDIESLGRAT